MTFSIRDSYQNQINDLQRQITNLSINPESATTVILDPGFTTEAETNVFRTWDAAYQEIENISGIRFISLRPPPASEDQDDYENLYFAGAAGTYDMTDIYITQTEAISQFSVNVLPGITLNNLRGIFGKGMSIDMTAATQDFITIPFTAGTNGRNTETKNQIIPI